VDLSVFENEDSRGSVFDPLAAQAERIFKQRQVRKFLIDADLLGEPAWDLLLCAYIASRKGAACSLEDVVKAVELPISTAQRWVGLLASRKMLSSNGQTFTISVEFERKLTAMFKVQLSEMSRNEGWAKRQG
jgi:hypothetical protein